MKNSKSVFTNLRLSMIGFGLLIGICFPFFLLLMGVPSEIALSFTFILACVFAGVLVGTVNIFLARINIKKPLQNLIDASGALAEGKMDIHTLKEGKDEFGVLNAAFLRVIKVFKNLTDEIGKQTDAISIGNLDLRISESAYSGQYRKLVAGVNRAVDTLVDHMEMMPQPVLIIDNNFSIRYINKAGANVIGKLKQELIGTKCYDGFRTSHCKTKECACYIAINEQREAEKETQAHPLKGDCMEIRYRGIPMLNDGQVIGAFEVVTDLTEIKKAKHDAEKQADNLAALLESVSNTAEQVVSGTDQVSGSSQSIAYGAAEQAHSIKELTASISEMERQTKHNASSANKASELTNSVKSDALIGNEKMKDMQHAMLGISQSSADISKIIKVIDDIAFQTNILALNAAVEAARAGVHGKGFAVVAEEVRNLAAKSAGSAKETSMLIEESLKRVEVGSKFVEETAEAFDNIVSGVEKAENLVSEIAANSNHQAVAIAEINRGVEQVSQVVQNNSHISKQAADASQELLNQAELLKSLVNQYYLSE